MKRSAILHVVLLFFHILSFFSVSFLSVCHSSVRLPAPQSEMHNCERRSVCEVSFPPVFSSMSLNIVLDFRVKSLHCGHQKPLPGGIKKVLLQDSCS